MTTGIEVKARPIFQKDIQKAFCGNELLKEIAHHFFRREGAPSIAREGDTKFVFQPVDAPFS